MRIAVYLPDRQRRLGGGDWIQVQRTVESINRLHLAQAELIHSLPENLHGYHILHVFNLLRPADLLPPILAAASAKIPVVLSSIYWDDTPYRSHGVWNQPSLADPLGRMAIQANLSALKADMAMRKAVLRCVDAVIALSRKEMELISAQLQPPDELLMGVAYNGVDKVFFSGQASQFTARYRVEKFILTVGRIEDRKNQLNLIRASRDLGVPLVVVGSPGHQVEYYRKCLSEGGQRTVFCPRMQPEELADAYAAASVFALPSWLDPAPLVCLEAAAAGCPVVTTSLGAIDEYLQGQCWLCDPGSVESIQAALLQALKARVDRRAVSRRIEGFTWDSAAVRVVDVYERVLARGYRPKGVDETWLTALLHTVEAAELMSKMAAIVNNYARRTSTRPKTASRLLERLRPVRTSSLDLRGDLKVEGMPGKVDAGCTIQVTLKVTNLSTDIWPDACTHPWPINIGYQWWQGHRLESEGRWFLPDPLRPGECAEWQDTLVVPDRRGHYRLLVGIVHEDHRWSGRSGGPELIFPLEVV